MRLGAFRAKPPFLAVALAFKASTVPSACLAVRVCRASRSRLRFLMHCLDVRVAIIPRPPVHTKALSVRANTMPCAALATRLLHVTVWSVPAGIAVALAMSAKAMT